MALHIKKLHLLVARAFAAPFFAGFSVALFILVLQMIAQNQDHIFGKGFSTFTIAKIFFYASMSLVVVSLALGMLLSSLMCMGALGENYELAALKSAGISLRRIIYPLFIIGLLVGGVAFVFTFFITPYTNLKLYSLLYDARQAKPTFALKPGLFNSLIDGYTLRIKDKRPDGMLLDVMIYDHTENRGNVKLTLADSGRMWMDEETQYLRLLLYHGATYDEQTADPKRPFAHNSAHITFDSLDYRIDLSTYKKQKTDEDLFRTHQFMLTVPQLLERIDSLNKRPLRVAKDVELFVENLMAINRRLGDSAQTRVAALAANSPLLPTQAPDVLQGAAMQAQNTARNVQYNISFQLERFRGDAQQVRIFQIELNKRFTLPLACIIFLFIGAPLGAIIRKGGIGMPVLVSALFFIIFYVLMANGEKIAKEGLVPVWFGVWLPIIVMIPLSFYISYQSITDSRLFDVAAWRDLGKLLLPRLGMRQDAA